MNRKHRWRAINDQIVQFDQIRIVKECVHCKARIVSPPPSNMSMRQYLSKVGIHRDCLLQEIKGLMES